MFEIPDLRALYDKPYDADMLEWRRLGAADKAAHIEVMLGPRLAAASSVLEVGSGTGDVSADLARAHPGTRFHGVEIGAERGALPERLRDLPNLSVEGYDGATLPFDDGAFDIVFATHVLEHVVHERRFLHELRRVARGQVFVEVPCEQVLGLSPARIQRTLNIGHINCYSPESFGLTLETSGLRVLEMRAFDPSDALRRHRGARGARLRGVVRRAALAAAPRLAQKLFCYHVAAVTEPAPKLTIG